MSEKHNGEVAQTWAPEPDLGAAVLVPHAVWPWAGYRTSLCLSSLTCKVGAKIVLQDGRLMSVLECLGECLAPGKPVFGINKQFIYLLN